MGFLFIYLFLHLSYFPVLTNSVLLCVQTLCLKPFPPKDTTPNLMHKQPPLPIVFLWYKWELLVLFLETISLFIGCFLCLQPHMPKWLWNIWKWKYYHFGFLKRKSFFFFLFWKNQGWLWVQNHLWCAHEKCFFPRGCYDHIYTLYVVIVAY